MPERLRRAVGDSMASVAVKEAEAVALPLPWLALLLAVGGAVPEREGLAGAVALVHREAVALPVA